ncbi:MAG: hypothetical protein ACJAVR_001137 [Paracoccaceae bacterium]|jgi:hypothetical protein
MIAALKSLFVMLFAVSLLCGTASMAHDVPMADAGGAHVMEPHGATDAHDCGSCDVADMGCATMATHCASAITSNGGGGLIGRVALRVDHASTGDLVLLGAGPESDTPPPRS